MTTTPPFPPLPRALRRPELSRHVATYAKPSRMVDRFTWEPGADWDDTMLGFQPTVIEAGRMVSTSNPFPYEPVHPAEIVAELVRVWRNAHRFLGEHGHVVDADAREGVTVEHDYQTDWTLFVLEVKTWPKVPGFTVEGPWEP